MDFKEQPGLAAHCAGGCGAKIGPGELAALLQGLPGITDPRLLVGFDGNDDAAVYQVNDEASLISTVDFFPPMVADPVTYGRIAAANALSDVYAMGGRPVMALNLVCFPQNGDLSVLKGILQGGAEKVAEAGAVLSGGHSIYDNVPKYGLAVTGLVDNHRILRNNTPQVGHQLILTKPLGVGLVLAANRGAMASGTAMAAAVASMTRLNRYTAEKLQPYPISACTDITGFGLLGHSLEMAGEQFTIRLHVDNLPVIPEALDYAADYLITAAGQRNRNHLAGKADVSPLPFAMQELLFDPQTSGGLLIAVAPAESDRLLQSIQKDDPHARIIGMVVGRQTNAIVFD